LMLILISRQEERARSRRYVYRTDVCDR
jgi:hypothetical protein